MKATFFPALLSAGFILVALGCQKHDASPSTEQKNNTQPNEEKRAMGGVIDGNGGEFITNEHNPWFIDDEPVAYCISRDQEAFSLAESEARVAIGKALETWKAIFADGLNVNGLASDFREVDCSATHDLEFQLGGSDATIEEALKHAAKNVVAMAYRDSYSDQSRRAKGRVWFSPDRGPRRYHGPSSTAEFWSVPDNFQNIVTHELGHVFGIRHTANGLMAEDFPARVIQYAPALVASPDSFLIDYRSCGKIATQATEDNPDSLAALSEIFGLNLKEATEACINYYEGNWSAPWDLPNFEPGDRNELVFTMADGTKATFHQVVTSGFGSPLLEIKGQYLNADNVYETWNFGTLDSGTSYQGLQMGKDRSYFMTIQSFFPGVTFIYLGVGDRWESFSIVKNPAQTQALIKLSGG